ncbi:MAG TPA: ferrochelatase [Geminicoccus sp.]|jgi:ferrochelatase|uniref:ferrochelatase n=1 Tax=Geminicoccus sp. TaxID=2024832 RepID=UPI002E33C65E|nr:ferrochelatase [Geminicoccus sp.]HEX2529079.1 ferrochelatase [Geminicoccus sp.]
MIGQIERPSAKAPATSPTGELPPGHPPVATPKIGVILSNLGTPDGTSYWPMRRYLSEFLSDRRVIEKPVLLWQALLQGVILTTRPSRKGKDYETIWNKDLDEGPLKTVTRSQAEQVGAVLKERYPNVLVEWGMRYANPSLPSVVDRLFRQGCSRLILLPLYPQYSAATTATGCDVVFKKLLDMRWQPALRTAPPYHDHPTYIAAIANSIREHLATLDWQPDKLVMSFHGMPKEYLLRGDPYHCQCVKTARLVFTELGLSSEQAMVCFQSRFGPDEWLQPYLDKTMEALPGQGVKKVVVISPGFSTDCLETLEEIEGENREIFTHAGGEKFSYVPCLNDGPAGIDLIVQLVERELAGWV